MRLLKKKRFLLFTGEREYERLLELDRLSELDLRFVGLLEPLVGGCFFDDKDADRLRDFDFILRFCLIDLKRYSFEIVIEN